MADKAYCHAWFYLFRYAHFWKPWLFFVFIQESVRGNLFVGTSRVNTEAPCSASNSHSLRSQVKALRSQVKTVRFRRKAGNALHVSYECSIGLLFEKAFCKPGFITASLYRS